MRNRTVTAVPGCLAGHATHASGTTGVTVLLFPQGADAGHHLAGHATGSRELEVLSPLHITKQIHGLCFAGGSVFGLAAADGIVRELAGRGIGYKTPHGIVPIVPAAILYDLDGGVARPDSALGTAAARAAGSDALREGRVGAGAGARVARVTGDPRPGGAGGWAERCEQGVVSALVIVNAFGAIRDPSTGRWVAGELTDDQVEFHDFPFGNTTLAAVVTDVPLSREQCIIVARMAAAGIARTQVPAFSPLDGDIVFAVSTGSEPGGLVTGAVKRVTEVGNLAARCVERAVLRAVVQG